MTDIISEDSSQVLNPAPNDPPAASTKARRQFALLHDQGWQKLSIRALVAYLLSRMCVVAGAAVVAAQRVVQDRIDGIARPTNAVHKIVDVLTSWDGKWYLAIVRDSYPSHVPAHVTFDDYQARTAFFPVYPALVRWFDKVLPGSDVFASLFLNFILGAVAVLLVGILARNFVNDRVAYRAMLLMAVFPGSFVLSFNYSEATLVVVGAGCLLCLQRRQWLAAGILASIGSATRANGIALIAACGIAALIAIVQDRRWRSLVAPLVAPIGFIGFHVFLWRRTGEKLIWFRTQSEAWHEGTSFGLTALRNTVDAFTRPLSSPTDVITAVSFLTTIALVYMAYRKRLPWPIATYTIVVLILMLAPSTVTARPRFLYTAFPLLISAAWWIVDFEDRSRARRALAAEGAEHGDGAAVTTESRAVELWIVILCAGAAGLVTLTALYGVFGAIP
jgi:Gpi18-like mannosyltransferase